MTEASTHHKEMKNLMGAEVFMLMIKDWQLQSVYHSTDGINDTAGKKPAKFCVGQISHEFSKGKYTGPAHSE